MSIVQSRVYRWLQDGNEITGQQIADLIYDNASRAAEQRRLMDRYKGDKNGVPILKRDFPIANASKVNNRLANDFFSDIINTKIGYVAGKPISYLLTKKDPSGPNITSENLDLLLDGFLKRNAIADLDSETIKIAAITGLGARLIYNDLEGKPSIINIPPWECVFIADEIGVSDAPYALRYYQAEIDGKLYTKAEFYDDTSISFWIREETGSTHDEAFRPDTTESANPQAHLMNGCPLIAFPNNEEMLGDCEKVLTLIDAYDRSISDVNSEIEQFRLAYLIFTGLQVSQETIDQLRQVGVIGMPDPQDKAEYLTKNINDVAIENHLNRLDENIIYFSQSVRFTDEAFGTASGVAMKFKLFNLESKCITTERKFIKALYRQFAALSGWFDKKGIRYDPWDLDFVFTRNFPLNLLDEAQSLATLKGLISDETAYAQMSFIDDPKKEIERKKAEDEEYKQAESELMEVYNQEGENNAMQYGPGQGTQNQEFPQPGAQAST